MAEVGQQDTTYLNSFNVKKRHYFSQLGLQARDALRLHQQAGLLGKTEGKREWGNVSEHCLVEAARSIVFSDLLHLPSDIKQDLVTAAVLHDFYKREEMELVTKKGATWKSFAEATEGSNRIMKKAGYGKRVIRLANSVGHGSFSDTKQILSRDSLTEEDIAYLVLHYIDDYTVGSEWVQAAQEENGVLVNELDRRVRKNELNQRYKQLDEEGRALFGGRTTLQVQRALGHEVEATLAKLIQKRSATLIEPRRLPEAIDGFIKDRINLE